MCRHEELSSFYTEFDAVTSLRDLNNRDLCKLRWKRIDDLLGRRSQVVDRHEDLNGRGGTSILLVHVGKTAGGAVWDMLLKAGLSVSAIHAHAVDARMIEEHSAVLLCLRDPVERTISAYNWRSPKQRKISAAWAQCGSYGHAQFYKCCQSLDEYADKIMETGRCGTIARQGECHLELDTCSYLGGVVDVLERNRQKVFVIDSASIERDMNNISNQLQWNKTFRVGAGSKLHRNEVPAASTRLSVSSIAKLSGYVELIGEAPLYRKLKNLFQLQ